MTKKREDLDMAAITDEAIIRYLDDRALTGAVPFQKLPPEDKDRLRHAFIPVIWSAIPSILAQLAEKPVATDGTPDEILAGFTVPDSLEGLIL